jgi:hypothetical protein
MGDAGQRASSAPCHWRNERHDVVFAQTMFVGDELLVHGKANTLEPTMKLWDALIEPLTQLGDGVDLRRQYLIALGLPDAVAQRCEEQEFGRQNLEPLRAPFNREAAS